MKLMAMFAGGFFLGASALFTVLYGMYGGHAGAGNVSSWLCADVLVVEAAILVGAILLPAQIYRTPASRAAAVAWAAPQQQSWLSCPRRAFGAGAFSGLIAPLLLGLLVFLIVAAYGLIVEGHPLSLFG